MVGSVILHGKKHLWGQPNRHYHEGLQSGDNTLNLLCVRVLLRSINKTGRYDPGDFLSDYIAFMTTPNSHRDTYAESYHRAFFANYAGGFRRIAVPGRRTMTRPRSAGWSGCLR